MSGLITEADHGTWTTADLRPVWDVLLSAFGADRLMFGSDWPVANLAGGWNRWAATVDELLDGCSADETSAILAGTATTFYRLGSTEVTSTEPTSTAPTRTEETRDSR